MEICGRHCHLGCQRKLRRGWSGQGGAGWEQGLDSPGLRLLCWAGIESGPFAPSTHTCMRHSPRAVSKWSAAPPRPWRWARSLPPCHVPTRSSRCFTRAPHSEPAGMVLSVPSMSRRVAVCPCAKALLRPPHLSPASMPSARRRSCHRVLLLYLAVP